MGHEERFSGGQRAAAEAEQARIQALPYTPEGQAAGLAPSPFLVEIAHQRLGQCNAAAGAIRNLLSRPNLTIAGRPAIDPVATTLLNVALLLDAQAATMDLLLSFLVGRPGLRPIAPPPANGGAPPEGDVK